jgi:hypothetical protein
MVGGSLLYGGYPQTTELSHGDDKKGGQIRKGFLKADFLDVLVRIIDYLHGNLKPTKIKEVVI